MSGIRKVVKKTIERATAWDIERIGRRSFALIDHARAGDAWFSRPRQMGRILDGLGSTLDDYLTFARLFVEGGAVNGRRLLRAETLALMTSNQLTPGQCAAAWMLAGRCLPRDMATAWAWPS